MKVQEVVERLNACDTYTIKSQYTNWILKENCKLIHEVGCYSKYSVIRIGAIEKNQIVIYIDENEF